MANVEDKVGWKLLGGVTATVAAKLSRKTAAKAYTKGTGEAPPEHVSSPAVPLRKAIIWAVLSSVTVAVVRLLVQRGAAAAWLRVRGELPPGLESKKDKKAKKKAAESANAGAPTGDN